MQSKILPSLINKFPVVIVPVFLIPLLALSEVISLSEWKSILLVLLVVNFGMDTGAWFFGKNFGKNKLWEKVSPKKTIEGLIGGMFTSAILGTLTWYIIFKTFDYRLLLLFGFGLR